jgi:hypothetical protein
MRVSDGYYTLEFEVKQEEPAMPGNETKTSGDDKGEQNKDVG